MTAGIETKQDGDAPERNGIYLLTFPRSASNLFQTMMDKQPGYQCSGYKLFKAGFQTFGKLDKGPWREWPEEDRKAITDEFRACWEGLQDEIADAKSKVSRVQKLMTGGEWREGRRRRKREGMRWTLGKTGPYPCAQL